MKDEAIHDVRLEKIGELQQLASRDAPAGRCVVCDRRLPNAKGRTHCLAHSEYPQALMREERRRRRARGTTEELPRVA